MRNLTNRPRQHHCSFVIWWWWRNYTMHVPTVKCIQKSHNKNLKNTIAFLLISGVHVSTRVWTSKASLQSPECWRQFSGPKTNRHLTLLGRTAEGPSWRRLPVSGSKSESDKKRKHPAEMGEPALFGVQGEQTGLWSHTSLCLKDLPHGHMGCDQNGWSHNRSSNRALYLRGVWANIKTVENIFLKITGIGNDQNPDVKQLPYKWMLNNSYILIRWDYCYYVHKRSIKRIVHPWHEQHENAVGLIPILNIIKLSNKNVLREIQNVMLCRILCNLMQLAI